MRRDTLHIQRLDGRSHACVWWGSEVQSAPPPPPPSAPPAPRPKITKFQFRSVFLHIAVHVGVECAQKGQLSVCCFLLDHGGQEEWGG